MKKTTEKVVSYYRELAKHFPKLIPQRMAELAPGVIAVEDTVGECEALFDIKLWAFKDPKMQHNGNHLANNFGLDVYESMGKEPHISTIKQMADFLKLHISPKGKQMWHKKPRFLQI